MPEVKNGGPRPATQIRMPTVRLEGGADPFGGALDVVIHADTVQICGRVWLPGRRLVICAREVDAEDGELDLSGAAAAPQHDATHAPVRLCGTDEQPDGHDGDAGGDGHDGGALTLHAERIVGRLTVLAHGSPGGSAEHGGNGHEPLRPNDARDASFTQHGPDGVPAGPYGAAVLAEECLPGMGVGMNFDGCEIAYGETGAPAKAGGNAGRGGRGGHGGHGGSITVRWVAVPKTSPQCIASGAPAGTPGDNGSPGAPGKPGHGGRNRLYWYGPDTTEEQFVGGVAAAQTLQYYGVSAAPRAGDGAKSQQFGTVPPPPEPASAGRDGQVVLMQCTAADMGALCEPAYFDDIRRWAEQDTARGTEWVERGNETGDPNTWLAGRGLLGRAQLGYFWLMALAQVARPDLQRDAENQLASIASFARAHPFVPATVA